jgi:glycerol uptake facilitator-like aquaporin
MRFARIVFIAAGIWGIAVLTPLYFLVDVTGRQYGPPIAYPHVNPRATKSYSHRCRVTSKKMVASLANAIIGIWF